MTGEEGFHDDASHSRSLFVVEFHIARNVKGPSVECTDIQSNICHRVI